MRRLVHFLLGGLPTTPAGTRALAATMADWRHETAKGGSLPNRLRGNTVGMWSVVRVLAVVSLKELPGAWTAVGNLVRRLLPAHSR